MAYDPSRDCPRGDCIVAAIERINAANSAARLSQGSPAEWANESYNVARGLVYGDLPHSPGVLRASYQDAAFWVVIDQLGKAGLRLALVVNQSLR